MIVKDRQSELLNLAKQADTRAQQAKDAAVKAAWTKVADTYRQLANGKRSASATGGALD